MQAPLLILATVAALLAALAVPLRRAKLRAQRAGVFGRELSGDLLEQAAAFDRLVVALAGIADDLDEGHVLQRTAGEACLLVSAETAAVYVSVAPGRLRSVANTGTGALHLPPALTLAVGEE